MPILPLTENTLGTPSRERDLEMAALRDQKREETKRRLYEAALAVFRRDGVVGCRIDDIVRAVGVSRGSFYFHFPTKDDVLLELMRGTERQITEKLDQLPANAPLRDILSTVREGLVQCWEADPSLLPEVASVGLRSAASALSPTDSNPLRGKLAARFRAAAQRGELSSLLPPEILSDLYLSHSLAGLLAWFGNQQADMHSVLAGVTELFFCGAQGDRNREPTPAAPPEPPAASKKAKPKAKAKPAAKAKSRRS